MEIITGILIVALGLIIAFAGYPLFRLILPLVGLLYGFMLGNTVLESTLFGLIIGVGLALVFAIGAYALWSFAIAFAGGVLGMSIGVGLSTALNLGGLLTAVLALGLGAVFLWLGWKLKDLSVILLTAASGAGAVAYGAALILPFLFGQPGSFNFFFLLGWIAVAVVAFLVQYRVYKAADRYGVMMNMPGQQLPG